MAIWDRFEDLVLEFMERRLSELLDQGDVTSPKVIANVRETAAWAAERAIRGELLEQGYEIIDTFTPAPQLATPLILGDETSHDCAISYFARQLKDLGILP